MEAENRSTQLSSNFHMHAVACTPAPKKTKNKKKKKNRTIMINNKRSVWGVGGPRKKDVQREKKKEEKKNPSPKVARQVKSSVSLFVQFR
jgi:hypothetical protein